MSWLSADAGKSKQIAAVPIFNHGGADVGVAEQLPDRADIVAIFQQRDGEGVAGPAGLAMPALSLASLTAFWITDSCTIIVSVPIFRKFFTAALDCCFTLPRVSLAPNG